MKNYINTINTWRKSWSTKTKPLSITGCLTIEETVDEAVKKAHSPSVLRVLKTNGISTERPRKEAASYLTSEILTMISRTSFTNDEYDDWVRKVCTRIRDIYRSYNLEDYTFGNAQKYFNMTIKYIFSADNIDPNLPIFKVAHIPVDGVIMNIAKEKLGVNKLNTYWSKTDNIKDIIDYQNRFRESLPEDYFPLLWECQNWAN